MILGVTIPAWYSTVLYLVEIVQVLGGSVSVGDGCPLGAASSPSSASNDRSPSTNRPLMLHVGKARMPASSQAVTMRTPCGASQQCGAAVSRPSNMP